MSIKVTDHIKITFLEILKVMSTSLDYMLENHMYCSYQRGDIRDHSDDSDSKDFDELNPENLVGDQAQVYKIASNVDQGNPKKLLDFMEQIYFALGNNIVESKESNEAQEIANLQLNGDHTAIKGLFIRVHYFSTKNVDEHIFDELMLLLYNLS